jgi:hypothetical protein
MKAMKLVTRIGKGIMVANMATLVRVLRRGFSSLEPRLFTAYNAIDPFDSAGDRFLKMIPETTLDRVVRQFSPMVMDSNYACIDGSLPWVDLTALLAIALDRAPRIMLEIGTFFGHTTRLLALNLPKCTIHTVDLPEMFNRRKDPGHLPKDDFHLIERRRVGAAFRADPAMPNIVQHFADTATWDFAAVKEASLFLIDGSHTYDYAKNDTEKCLAQCKGRRVTFLWHDCDAGHRGVIRYLAEMVQKGFPIKHLTSTNLAILDC